MGHRDLSAGEMKGFDIRFADKEITAWGGMGIMKRMLDHLEFDRHWRHADYLDRAATGVTVQSNSSCNSCCRSGVVPIDSSIAKLRTTTRS